VSLSKQKLEQLRTTGLLVEVDSRGRVTVPNGKPNWRYRVISYNDGTIVMEPLGPVIIFPPTRVPGSEKEVTDVPDLEGRL
jgi:bifunctional DNA-binding transcriptional regulator/antitoxin component of YhaV-PrlF toxin-antitoxin module